MCKSRTNFINLSKMVTIHQTFLNLIKWIMFLQNRLICSIRFTINLGRLMYFYIEKMLGMEWVCLSKKSQGSGGTTDEKFPYVLYGLSAKLKRPAVLVLSGNGFKAYAVAWARKFVTDFPGSIRLYN